LKAQGKPEEAARHYRRALTLFEQALAPHHSKVITCRENYHRLLEGVQLHEG